MKQNKTQTASADAKKMECVSVWSKMTASQRARWASADRAEAKAKAQAAR